MSNSKRLYVIHSPSYAEIHPSHTVNQVLIDSPLSEHYTYLYYNLIKYGLADEVVIFPREGIHDNHKNDIQTRIDIDSDKKFIQINWERDKMIDIINADPGSYVYFWGKFEDAKKIKNSFVIINPVVIATNVDNCIDSQYHHYALLESLNHEKTFNVLPKDIPIGVLPTTSERFTLLDVDKIQKVKKDYDWIIVSSMDPRKRHIEFLNALQKHPNFKNLKGCIAARNPDNKRKINNGHYVLQHIVSTYVHGTKNVDLFLNVNNDLKIDLLSRSKIFVCTSTFDVGPRAVVEAMQAGLPVLTMPHIGAATWVKPGENGELIDDVDHAAHSFYNMLEMYNQGQYMNGARKLAEEIKPEFLFPQIVEDIKKHYHLKFSK